MRLANAVLIVLLAGCASPSLDCRNSGGSLVIGPLESRADPVPGRKAPQYIYCQPAKE